jgi:hypothetical protein
MSNREIRRLYIDRISQISKRDKEWTRQGLTAEDRARRCWRIRHEARLSARDLMSQQERTLLENRDFQKYGDKNGPSFEWKVRQAAARGYEGDAIFESIIQGASSTNPEVDAKLGQ